MTSFIGQIFEFLLFLNSSGSKPAKFKDAKTAIYFIKDASNKRYVRGLDYALGISEWLDEIYIGKYEITPEFHIIKLDDDSYQLKILIRNKRTGESHFMEAIYAETESFEDYSNQEVANLTENSSHILPDIIRK